MDIELTFVNNSTDENNSSVVIFQKDTSPDFGDMAVAWHVIPAGVPQLPLQWMWNLSASGSDGQGKHTAIVPARQGEAYTVKSGYEGALNLVPQGRSGDDATIDIVNGQDGETIDAHVYRNGKLLAVTHGVAPGAQCSFTFKPTIWVGTVPHSTQEGQILHAQLLSGIETELSLEGIASAQIVMTGGGAGPAKFALQNVVKG